MTYSDFAAAAVILDDRYERRGQGWVDEVVVNGRTWPRPAVWMHPPRHLHVEASSREAFAEICSVVAGLPSTVKPPKTTTRSSSCTTCWSSPRSAAGREWACRRALTSAASATRWTSGTGGDDAAVSALPAPVVPRPA